MKLKIELQNTNIPAQKLEGKRAGAREALDTLWSGELDYTGWVKYPHEFTDDKIQELVAVSKEIRSKCDYFLVLGVGGSFMGAKAVIDALEPCDADTKVLFAGYNFNARYIREVMDTIGDKDVCICVISKSGSTAETLSAYGIFKEWMLARYGKEETASRTYVITERRSNFLYDAATEEGCTIMDLPLTIGGRYSVLTPVGLLPIAVAGIDIQKIMDGARSIASKEAILGDGTGLDYAITRNLFFRGGRQIEVYEFFDPYLAYIGEWLKQLFGESEGKEQLGIFPTSLLFSRDLHSMGQFLQDGTPNFFETFITVGQSDEDLVIPETAMEPFAGKTIQSINECAEKGVLDAHVEDGIPAISIHLQQLDEEALGEMIYYFETQCAISALLFGLNPFDQPGVEAYKKSMRSYIQQL